MEADMNVIDPEVASVFDAYPDKLRQKMLHLRNVIFEVACDTDGVGDIEETLKWGQPSYLTLRPKTGTTIRIDQHDAEGDEYAMYFHCQTTLIDSFREQFSDEMRFEGNRAIVFGIDEELPMAALKECIALALTYHRRKSAAKR